MLKDMIIKIKVIDEFGEFYGAFGEFEEEDINKLIEIATKEHMTCLSFIDLPRDTYFNTPQCIEIKNEVKKLHDYKGLNKNLLNSIDQAVNLAITEECFVKFEVAEKFLESN